MRGERGGSLTYEISSNSKKKLNNKVSHSLIVGCLGKETSEIRVFYVVVQFGVNKTKYMTILLLSIHTLSLPKINHYVLIS